MRVLRKAGEEVALLGQGVLIRGYSDPPLPVYRLYSMNTIYLNLTGRIGSARFFV